MKPGTMRTFKTGATRGSDKGKIDPEAALSPLVLEAYCSYIREHRLQGSREARSDDNWQKGIPIASYMKSLLRHVLEAWRAYRVNEPMNAALFAIMFNTMGMLHERLKTEMEDLAREDWLLSGLPQPIYEDALGFSYHPYGKPTPTQTKPPYNVPYVNEHGDNCTLIDAVAVLNRYKRQHPWTKFPYHVPTPTSPKTTMLPEERAEWLEFHRNMRASSLPNEDDYRALVLQEQGATIVPQCGPKIS